MGEIFQQRKDLDGPQALLQLELTRSLKNAKAFLRMHRTQLKFDNFTYKGLSTKGTENVNTFEAQHGSSGFTAFN